LLRRQNGSFTENGNERTSRTNRVSALNEGNFEAIMFDGPFFFIVASARECNSV
jgi:hypothetical protein